MTNCHQGLAFFTHIHRMDKSFSLKPSFIGLGKIGLLIRFLGFLSTNKVGSKPRTSLIAPSNAHIGDFSAFTHLTAWGPLEVNLGFPVSC